jgi:hypothetical protein
LQHCPACKSKRISGAGSFVEVPAPQDSTEPDLRNPVQMLTVDRGSLDYNVEESQRLAAEIFTGVTGVQGEAINNQAVNEKQVFAGLESETNVLERLQTVLKESKSGQKKLFAYLDTGLYHLRVVLFLTVRSFICTHLTTF